jgi:hypothetical protein
MRFLWGIDAQQADSRFLICDHIFDDQGVAINDSAYICGFPCFDAIPIASLSGGNSEREEGNQEPNETRLEPERWHAE